MGVTVNGEPVPETTGNPVRWNPGDHAACDAEIARLRTELEHAKSALAGDNEGIRLWMLDCGNLVEQHRERAREAEGKLASAVAAERDRILAAAEDRKVTLARPGNGPARWEETDVVPLGVLRELLHPSAPSAGKAGA